MTALLVLVAVLGVALLSWLDRQRGTPKESEVIPKLPALLGMGYLCAAYTGHYADWQAAAITAAFAVVHNISFGEPMGHALSGQGGLAADDGAVYETWQVGVLKTNPWLALAVRGAMSGLAGVAALDSYAAAALAVAWGIAFPAAPALARFVLYTKDVGARWAANEYIRGALAGLVLAPAWGMHVL